MTTLPSPTKALSLLLLVMIAGGVDGVMTRWSAAEEISRGDSAGLAAVDRGPRLDVLANKADPRRQSAVASDLDPAAEIAHELFQLQQQLGGSIVTDRSELEDWKSPSAPVTSRSAPLTPPLAPSQRQSPPPWSEYPAHVAPSRRLASAGLPDPAVVELREAAWQLVTTAHRLEQLDLYEQADALRALADQLRQDARGRKQAERAAQAKSVRVKTP